MVRNKRQNLLIVCAGNDSLHLAWADYRKSFDIITIYFGDDNETAQRYKKISDLFFRAKGLKISLARNILLEHLYFREKFNFSEYEHVCFPDDDLKFYEGDQDIERLFEIAKLSRADVFQPAIQNENFSAMWEATRLIEGLFAHRTNIVEVMAHGFSGEAFEKCYLTAIHVCEFMKSGWGLEPVWTKIGESVYQRSLRTYVFDVCPIIHIRPIGKGDSLVHKIGHYEATYVPQIYTNRIKILARYKNLQTLLQDNDYEVKVNAEEIESYHNRNFERFIKAQPSLKQRIANRVRRMLWGN